jgi:K+-sensing histidine kinase KdpD
MAYTKRESYINRPQTNQGKSTHVKNPLWRHSRVGYLLCLPLVGFALLGSFLEQQLGLHSYFSSAPLLLAVVLISLFWGTGPALLGILASMLILDYMYVPLSGSFDLHTWDGLLQMLPFILCGVLIAIITAQRETARRRALASEQEVNTYADKLELNNRLLGEVIMQARRELKTSLSEIAQQVQVIEQHFPVEREEAPDKPVYEHALELIDMQTHHLQALNAALLSVEKDQANEAEASLAPFDLCAFCRLQLADASLYQGRKIEIQVPSHPIMVQLDREDMRQVIVNVVRHALKHSPPHGIVQIYMSQDKEHIHVLVREAEGERSEEHEQSQLDSPHPELHPASRNDSDLWFVISQTIVEWYNGRMSYTASSDGGGYTCSIELPAY